MWQFSSSCGGAASTKGCPAPFPKAFEMFLDSGGCEVASFIENAAVTAAMDGEKAQERKVKLDLTKAVNGGGFRSDWIGRP